MNATRRPWANIFSASLLLCAAAGASAQTAAVPLNGLGATPQNGTLAAIDTEWDVAGAGNGWDNIPASLGGPYGHYNGANGLQTWTFSKPVDLRFTVLGLNGPREGIKLPVGTRCQVPTGASITFDAATGVVAAGTGEDFPRGAIQIPCQLAGVTTLELDGRGLGPAGNRRGLGELNLSIPEITSAAPPATGTVGTDYTHTVVATDSDPDEGVALVYSATGLPPGLSIDAATGVISGTPTTAGTYTVVVTAANGPVQSLGQRVDIVIGAATVAVPTLKGWGLGALALAMGALGVRQSRRRARRA